MYIITGQTATGKTSYAQELALKYNGEIINCDSRQIYKKLNIITGKDIHQSAKYILTNKYNNFDIGYYNLQLPNQIESKLWLYDIADPHDYFSSYDYRTCALHAINKIKQQNKTPILVGGTYLYIKHLIYEITTEVIPPNFELREQLNRLIVEELQTKLQSISIQSFKRLNHSDMHNPRRLIRHIEIALASKIIKNENGVNKNNLGNFDMIGFRHFSKDTLIKHIQDRVGKRLKEGAVEEVENLLQLGYNESDPGIKTIGYISIIKYLRNLMTKEEAIKEWITKEVQYAKRQLTFMKTDPHIKWKEIQ